MMLVDTSVWIDHLNGKDGSLGELLEQTLVLTHPFVIGELACGNLKNRAQILDNLRALTQLPAASDAEVQFFIERKHLMGKGIGYVDAHLLAAVVLAGPVGLWTRDTRLRQAADSLGIATQPDSILWSLHESTPVGGKH